MTSFGFSFLGKLRIVKCAVEAALAHKLVVVARFGDLAVLQHEDRIRVLNGGKAVRDDKAGTRCHQLVQRLLNLDLRTGVNV